MQVKTKTKQYDISQKDREIMELLAEEHNYFASKRRETRIPEFDPLVLRIAEEHAYRLVQTFFCKLIALAWTSTHYTLRMYPHVSINVSLVLQLSDAS